MQALVPATAVPVMRGPDGTMTEFGNCDPTQIDCIIASAPPPELTVGTSKTGSIIVNRSEDDSNSAPSRSGACYWATAGTLYKSIAGTGLMSYWSHWIQVCFDGVFVYRADAFYADADVYVPFWGFDGNIIQHHYGVGTPTWNAQAKGSFSFCFYIGCFMRRTPLHQSTVNGDGNWVIVFAG